MHPAFSLVYYKNACKINIVIMLSLTLASPYEHYGWAFYQAAWQC
jgi:hypothetical protein